MRGLFALVLSFLFVNLKRLICTRHKCNFKPWTWHVSRKVRMNTSNAPSVIYQSKLSVHSDNSIEQTLSATTPHHCSCTSPYTRGFIISFKNRHKVISLQTVFTYYSKLNQKQTNLKTFLQDNSERILFFLLHLNCLSPCHYYSVKTVSLEQFIVK